MVTPARYDDLRDAQHDVLTRRQLDDLGVSESTVRAQLGADRWRAVNDRVVLCHNGPMTRHQQRWAVILSAEPPIALCSLTALEEAGLTGFAVAATHVVVPRGARLLPLSGVPLVIHESRRFSAEDIAVGPQPPRTAVERSVIDAAAWSKDPVTAARLLTAVVQQRLTNASRILETLATAGQIRFHKLMALYLTDIEGGAQALSELEFVRFCRRHGFPRPELQIRRDSSGRRRYLDGRIKRRDGRYVYFEVDGGVHLTLTTRWADTAKDNDDALDGRQVLRFPSVAIYTDDERAVAQLRRALRT